MTEATHSQVVQPARRVPRTVWQLERLAAAGRLSIIPRGKAQHLIGPCMDMLVADLSLVHEHDLAGVYL